MPGKNRKCVVYLLEVASYINKLFGLNFWCNYIECSNKMGLTNPMRMFNEVT